MFRRISNSRACLVIVLLWILTRAFPFSQAVPWTDWGACEAKKLLEYGFANRRGAIINIHYMTGLVRDPWSFNYVNHPYPILWLETLLYALGGANLVVGFNTLLGLLTCCGAYAAFRQFYSERLSLLGALIFTIIPTTILFDVDANISSMGAILWPFAVLGVAKALDSNSKARMWGVGLLVLIAGMISWTTYTIFPFLLLGALSVRWEKGIGLCWEKRWQLALAICLGAALTISLFVLQILYYTPDWSQMFEYLEGQAGQQRGVSNAVMIMSIALRSILSVGPVPAICFFVAWWLCWRRKEANWLVITALLYPILFAVMALALRRYFYREIHLYEYLAFPLTVLVLETYGRVQSRLWHGIILTGLIGALAYPIARASIPLISRTSIELAQTVRPLLPDPYTVLASNMVRQQSPFRSWDVGGLEYIPVLTDRLVRAEITDRQKLESLLASFKTSELKVVFLWHPGLALDSQMAQWLQGQPSLQRHRFVIPVEPVTATARLRSIYWKLTGRHQVREPSADASEIEFVSVRLLLRRDSAGMVSVTSIAQNDH
jgi:hypothetical protein